eukprot:scaffold39360_cov36-Tisochrysis_lutea.AAC.1
MLEHPASLLNLHGRIGQAAARCALGRQMGRPRVDCRSKADSTRMTGPIEADAEVRWGITHDAPRLCFGAHDQSRGMLHGVTPPVMRSKK